MSPTRNATFESASLRSIERLNPKLLDEVREKLGVDALTPEAIGQEKLESIKAEASLRGARGPMLESMAFAESPPTLGRAQLEAIVLKIIRPPLLVQKGTFVRPANMVPQVKLIVDGLKRDKIDPAIARTARVELGNVPGRPFVGTGWIVRKLSETKAIMVTNRHVAEEFARADGRGAYNFMTLPNFRDYQVNVDFLEEQQGVGARQAPVVKVVFMAGSGASDIALLEVEGEELRKLDEIDLSTAQLKVGAPIGVIGYPAYDSRSDPEDVAEYFGDIFDVKRFAFGDVTGVSDASPEFTHDATTLGGNSGSVVIDRDSGKAVGLHFAGDYKIANYAVPASEINAALKGLTSVSVVPSKAGTEAAGDGRHKPEHFRDRDGYNTGFLGKSKPIEPPKPGAQWQDDLIGLTDADSGQPTKELKYRHFSVWMCKSRKLPLMTAVNIDGGQAKRMGRVDKWYIDGRVGDDLQVDNAAYARNPLDRGHMVRREDPVWGPLDLASEANLDTFHYTNAAPQHEDLNQRDWVGLEDYVLSNARTRGLKISVFTGPVFGDRDADYRGLVKLPESFWKIVAIINDETGKPSVTGYLLCQGDMIKGLTGEFVYGPYKTYQVEIDQIGQLARLDVAHLAKHDPLAKVRKSEGLAGSRGAFRSINGPSDLVV
ncbi:DNA/RNA non-specific endonuclease [Mesorhizobium sp. GbtcB19]|uniref:DNA/RNA non-specific endonuclease n=1 Tax=Mesorhizobium sp. GbtcB19 TaxID=2824764 RepID=UPI001C2FB3FF|nr:DNA/RNA non-specific endonuclease [Mesorhizobium sp. GbtcB19]